MFYRGSAGKRTGVIESVLLILNGLEGGSEGARTRGIVTVLPIHHSTLRYCLYLKYFGQFCDGMFAASLAAARWQEHCHVAAPFVRGVSRRTIIKIFLVLDVAAHVVRGVSRRTIEIHPVRGASRRTDSDHLLGPTSERSRPR